MLSLSDFTTVCDPLYLEIGTATCTPETCCIAYGKMSYLPNLPANIFFAAVFLLLLLPNAIIGIRYKTWSFFAWMSLGLIGEAIGYIGRIMLYYNIFDFNAFLMYLVPLTIAPAFITASIYLCLARIISVLDPTLRYSRLKPMTYTKIFVTFDLISLLLQAAGGALASISDSQSETDTGVNIMIAGLAFQVFSLVVFICLCLDFAIRLYRGFQSISWRSPKSRTSVNTEANTSYESEGPAPVLDETSKYEYITTSFMFKAFVCSMAAATILILTRSVYRLLELQEGFDGELANNEVLFMILEPPMIFISCSLLIVFNPAFALKGLWSMTDFRSQQAQGIEMNHAEGVKPKSDWFTFGKDKRRGTYEAVRV
ncbi:RTA1 like protein-domain-containing protein [Xylariaceae sp. FL0016]|nr:RTA1 like protein-domain-containing protein [Xylariaceae sp. FL0016]